MEKKIECYARYIEKNGAKFSAYDCKTKDGKNCNCKFTQDCVKEAKDRGIEIPDGRGDKRAFIIVIQSENANYSESGRYPTLWVNKIDNIEDKVYKDTVSDLF